MIPTLPAPPNPYGRRMGWVAAAVSGVAATVGVTTIVIGLQADATGGGLADVWIDGPRAEASLAPGDIVVSAHATAEARIEDLVLEVDGQQVAEAQDVERNGKLVYATFTWTADEGEHLLVVTQEGGDGARSAERLVYVGEPLTPVPAKPTRTPSEKPSEKPRPSEIPSPSETPSESATPTVEPKPEPRPTKKPTEKPTPEPEPQPAPVIDAASIAGNPPTVYQGNYCPTYTVQVQARVRNATKVTVLIAGVARTFAMTASGSSWTATLPSGYDPGAIGTHGVSVRAVGPGGTATRPVGDLLIKAACPKD